MNGRVVSVSHLTALEAPPEAFIDYAAGAGFNAVGLRINPPIHTADRWPVAGDMARAKALRARADDRGLTIFEAETFSIWPDFDVERMMAGMEAAAAMGARMMVCAGIDEDEARLIDSYGVLADRAAGFGLVVGIEFMPFRPMASLADAVRVQAGVGRANAGILIDALHLSRCSSDPAAVAALDPGTIAYVHLCDAPALLPDDGGFAEEARGNRLYPGEGGLPLLELLSLLPDDMAVSVEAPNPRYADRPLSEQIKIAGRATLTLLDRVAGSTRARRA